MIHAIVALLIQSAIGLLTGDWWVGAALGAGIFMGREHAQAEYRWIETYGLHVRANMPWHGGFQLRVWGLKSLLDWALPVVCTVTVATLIGA